MHWKTDPGLYPPYLRGKIRRGRGVGFGQSYVPWLKIRDVPSQGTSSNVPGIIHHRPYHLLSELEAIYFFLTERKRTTVDVLEQWPILDIDRTLELCAAAGVRHQYRGYIPQPFTIDFLIMEQSDTGVLTRAASIKTAEEAADPAVRLRLSIEYDWCSQRGIPWTLVDTSAFNKTVLSNLRFIRAWFQHGERPSEQAADRFAQRFLASYKPNVCLVDLINMTSKQLRLHQDLADGLFRYCAWSDRIPVSLKHLLEMNMPVVLHQQHERT
ncbi:TnsA endonuclease N-terminal domain-containing protein [Variovorax sp. HJSM1_2]|uniref:TnsA endonuclease N-terminal domain-containing protein n=1 Tax=Variovorax sp. HJSM1_2 TaxID=3366263 RepID=UPI003BDAFD3D